MPMHAWLLGLLLLPAVDEANRVAAIRADDAPVLVVCPSQFTDALSLWAAYRREQGYQVHVASSSAEPARIKQTIRSLAANQALSAVVLVGDVPPAGWPAATVAERYVPAHHERARVNVLWGSEPEIATDHWYADLNDDHLPDFPIGRLPADNPDELRTIVGKIIDYEQSPPPGLWRRRINFVAGVGGFGAVADQVLESATKKFLTDGIPPAYQTQMTYGSWRSAYCPDPRRFHEATLDRLNEGSLFWVYIGHGSRQFLDYVRTPLGRHRVMDTSDVARAECEAGLPIAIFLACYTGAFDDDRDCLAEELLRRERGPVAVLCGSRITMPYAMAVMATEMMHAQFAGDSPTLGATVHQAKLRMMATPPATTAESAAPAHGNGNGNGNGNGQPPNSDQENRRLLEAIAAAISPRPDLMEEERREHLYLFNLLGDPLLRLPRPQAVELSVAAEVRATESIVVRGRSPLGGACTLELVTRRDRLRDPAPIRPEFDARHEALCDYDVAYAAANDPRWCSIQFPCGAGEFLRELAIPAAARGPCFVRVFVQGSSDHALGAAELYVRRPATSPMAAGQ